MQLTKLKISQFFNKHQVKILGLFVISLTILALSQHSAQAASRWIDNAQDSFTAISPTFNVEAGGKPIDPRTYVANIIKVVLGFLGFIAVCLLIYAGFTWMTAAGDSKKVGTAQGIIKTAVIGLFVILAAFGITIFVSNAIIGSTGTGAPIIRQNI